MKKFILITIFSIFIFAGIFNVQAYNSDNQKEYLNTSSNISEAMDFPIPIGKKCTKKISVELE